MRIPGTPSAPPGPVHGGSWHELWLTPLRQLARWLKPGWHRLRKELRYRCCLASPPAAAFRFFTIKQHFASKNTQGEEGA